MFKVGDFVNYSAQGICKVVDIRQVGFGRVSKEYFILKPINKDCSQIFVPCDNEKLLQKMRAVLSPQQIDSKICETQNRELSWIDDRKQREARFKEILTLRNETELLLLAKCLFLRQKNSPKGLSGMDSAFLKRVETVIAEEFSFALNIPKEKTGEYIREKLGI